MANTKTITGVDRSKLDSFRGKMKKFGAEVPDGDDVEIKAPFGVKMRASYVESAETLTLEILDKPVFVPESQIWSIVDSGTA
ncbi:MAG: hypothetical protein JNL64_10200 [Blastocatellia bacterium]|nr:hypothetical protein [Blastocatellia bacterium]